MSAPDLREATRPIIIITGGRDFCPSVAWADLLRKLYSAHAAATVFEGEARGADRFAAAIARRESIPVHTVPALWDIDGRKRAGPVRNARMLRWAMLLGGEVIQPVKLFAFPGDRGTADMTARCVARGVEIVEVRL